MKLTNKAYDVLKWIALILLPALGALYFALAKIWQLPYSEEIVGTITAIDAFLGALLGISTKNYQGEGSLLVNETDPEEETLSIALNEDLKDILSRDTIMLRVEK